MPSSAHRFGALKIVSAAAILVFATTLPRASWAQDGTDYTISEDDGYGIADCMHAGRECGRVIADSWCESHGHAHVLAYGLGSDVTGSIGASAATISKIAANDVVIRCGD